MLTNKLILTFYSDSDNQGLSLSITDRHGILLNDLVFTDLLEHTASFDIKFPNTLYIEIKNANHAVHLKSLKLSGLFLSDQILDQICFYRAADSESEMVTRHWYQNGTVKIDFFAANWVQYHLLYGNKITKL